MSRKLTTSSMSKKNKNDSSIEDSMRKEHPSETDIKRKVSFNSKVL